MKRFGLWLVLLGATFIPMARTDAHGLGNQKLEQVEAGPYLVSAWTDPKDVSVEDELHITVSVQDQEKDFILDADVQINAVLASDSSTTKSQQATHDNAAQKLFYEAPLRLDKTGRWQITIVIDGELGQGTASFELDVVEASNKWTRWLWPALGITAVVIILAFGMMYRKNKPQGSK
ncbi:MAG: hypothetical protein K8L91_06745 [Anaerolineae bacterium]|nr:hypothetical protein [Anaerolineae bacterium]